MGAWSEIPDDLQWSLFHSHDPNILDYLDEHHRCVHGNHGSRVQPCDNIAYPGSWYCYNHVEGAFCE